MNETWVQILDGGNAIHEDGGFRATLKDLQYFAEKHNVQMMLYIYPDQPENGE